MLYIFKTNKQHIMKKSGFNIRIINENFGELLNETFMDKTQFEIFLKMVHSCVEMGDNLTFFNGQSFFINIPNRFLIDSIIVTKELEISLTTQINSKIEALVTVNEGNK